MWFLCNKLNLLKDSETVTELMIKKNHSFMMAHLRDLIQTGWLEEYLSYLNYFLKKKLSMDHAKAKINMVLSV